MVIAHGIRGRSDYLSLRRDVTSWSPELARQYRATALMHRERYAWMRTIALMIGVVLVISTLMVSDSLPSYLIPFGFLVALLGFTGDMYSQCLMPRDPDLRQAVPSPT